MDEPGPAGAEDYLAEIPGAPTELAPSADETTAHTAWALDDGPEWKPPFWTPDRITAVAVCVAVLAVVVATGLAGYHLRPGPQPAAAPATTTSSTPTTTTAAAPPETVTSEPPPLPPTHETVTITRETVTREVAAPIMQPPAARFPTPAEIAVLDQQLLINLQRRGWTILDGHLLAVRAHEVCAELQNGASPMGTVEKLRSFGESFPNQADQFVTAVMATYPSCP